jgi:long-chain fatty acid transport protein
MRSAAKLTGALLAFSLAPAIALATDGYFQHGYGVKAQGIGGVGIALPQDGLAAATNPAGTAFVGDRLDVGVTWFAPKRGAEISGNGNPANNGSFDGNGKKDFFLPEFGYTKQLSPSLAAGVAVYGNGGMNTTYNGGIPLFGGNKAGINLEQLFISPSLAWKPNENNAIGAAINFAYQRFEAKGLSGFAGSPGPSVSPADVTDRGVDSSTGWGLRLGWTGKVTPDLTLGATWSSKISASKFDKYKGLFADGGSFDIPESYGVGLAWKATPALTVAADVEEIKYGSVRSVANSIANFATAGLGSANGAGFGWKDITVYKLGVSYDLSKDLTLRAGYNHSDQPIPSSQTAFNILAPGVVQDHLSLGGTWKNAGGGELSVAYTHAFKKAVNGSGSLSQFGGGEANIHLEENILGIAYGWKL